MRYQHILFALLLPLLLTCGGCTDDVNTRRTLNSAGYTDIQTRGYGWFSCGKGDDFATEFTAKNPQGRYVDGVVCCGFLKSCTIRF